MSVLNYRVCRQCQFVYSPTKKNQINYCEDCLGNRVQMKELEAEYAKRHNITIEQVRGIQKPPEKE